MKEQYSAGVVVFRHHNGQKLYLALHHTGGHWGFAKGKMEPGESKHQTALRELKEEAGITASLLDGFEQTIVYRFVAPNGERVRKTVYFFVGETYESDIVLSHEHKAYDWLSYPDAIQQITYKNTQQILMYADAFLESRTESK